MNGGLLEATALKIASVKVSMPLWEAFFKGMLCNVLVCLAVWLAMSGRSLTDKILAIVFRSEALQSQLEYSPTGFSQHEADSRTVRFGSSMLRPLAGGRYSSSS